MKIVTGDIVKLKEGGPDMTAAKILGEEIMCIWFNEKGILMEENFDTDKLTLKTPAENTGLNEKQNPDNIK